MCSSFLSLQMSILCFKIHFKEKNFLQATKSLSKLSRQQRSRRHDPIIAYLPSVRCCIFLLKSKSYSQRSKPYTHFITDFPKCQSEPSAAALTYVVSKCKRLNTAWSPLDVLFGTSRVIAKKYSSGLFDCTCSVLAGNHYNALSVPTLTLSTVRCWWIITCLFDWGVIFNLSFDYILCIILQLLVMQLIYSRLYFLLQFAFLFLQLSSHPCIFLIKNIWNYF